MIYSIGETTHSIPTVFLAYGEDWHADGFVELSAEEAYVVSFVLDAMFRHRGVYMDLIMDGGISGFAPVAMVGLVSLLSEITLTELRR
jgi:hypothetical protein